MKPGGLEGDRIIRKREAGAAQRRIGVGKSAAITISGACATQDPSWASSRPVRRSATVITADGCSRCAIRADVRHASIRTSNGWMNFFGSPAHVELSIEDSLAAPVAPGFSTSAAPM